MQHHFLHEFIFKQNFFFDFLRVVIFFESGHYRNSVDKEKISDSCPWWGVSVVSVVSVSGKKSVSVV